MPKEQVVYRFPKDSNVRYLALVYILPQEMIATFPTLSKFSRCFGEVAKSVGMADLINSDQFFNEIMDAVSALAFPHFGFSGWKEHYTGYFPVWKLSYYLPL